MSEIVAWPEGNIWFWTGTATASALVAYATDINAAMQYGVENYKVLSSAHKNRWTGQRVDLFMGALRVIDNLDLQVMADAKTAVHLHHQFSNAVGESGGHYLYSGAIDSLTLAGRDGDLFRFTLAYHANIWSAY